MRAQDMLVIALAAVGFLCALTLFVLVALWIKYARERDRAEDLGPAFEFIDRDIGAWTRRSRTVDAPSAGPADPSANVYSLWPPAPSRLDDHRGDAA